MNQKYTKGEEVFVPRNLTRSELLRLDVYMYHSPKLNRGISVISPAALAMLLDFEYRPEVVTMVERPRYLKAGESSYELTFWSHTIHGQEMFHLITSFPSRTATEVHKSQLKKESLIEAGKNAHIALQIIPDTYFLRMARVNSNRLRILPYVQTARELPDIDEVKARILELFEFQQRISFQRIEQTIQNIDSRNIRAATCALIHSGKLNVDLTTKLHDNSIVEINVVRP